MKHGSWHRSRFCDTGHCVEVKATAPGNPVLVRDSKNVHGPNLSFGEDNWRRFLADLPVRPRS